MQGINQVFQRSHSETPLIVGAAKSCIGHTEVAAGLVGVLKVIASFRHSAIPGLMHLTAENMNPSFNCGIIPMYIPHELFPLPPKENGTPYRSVVL
jgi:acyl transferase domain-containing protein